MPVMKITKAIMGSAARLTRKLDARKLTYLVMAIFRDESLTRTQAKFGNKWKDWRTAEVAWSKLVATDRLNPSDLAAIGAFCRQTKKHALYQSAIGLAPLPGLIEADFPKSSSMTNAVRIIRLKDEQHGEPHTLIEKIFSNESASLAKNLEFYELHAWALEGLIPKLKKTRQNRVFTALYFEFVQALDESTHARADEAVINAQCSLSSVSPSGVKHRFPTLITARLNKFSSRYMRCHWRLFTLDREALALLKKFKKNWSIHHERYCLLPRYLSHGDFRKRNVLIRASHNHERPSGVAIIDWDNWGYAPFGTDLAFYLRDRLELATAADATQQFIDKILARLPKHLNSSDVVFSLYFISIADHVYRLGREDHQPFREEIDSLKSSLSLFFRLVGDLA